MPCPKFIFENYETIQITKRLQYNKIHDFLFIYFTRNWEKARKMHHCIAGRKM